MAFLMTSKNYLNILVGQLFFTSFFVPSVSVSPIRPALYLNEGALLSFVTSQLLTSSSLLKRNKLHKVSE